MNMTLNIVSAFHTLLAIYVITVCAQIEKNKVENNDNYCENSTCSYVNE